MQRVTISELQRRIQSLEATLEAKQRECRDMERDLRGANKSIDNLLRSQLDMEKARDSFAHLSASDMKSVANYADGLQWQAMAVAYDKVYPNLANPCLPTHLL